MKMATLVPDEFSQQLCKAAEKRYFQQHMKYV